MNYSHGEFKITRIIRGLLEQFQGVPGVNSSTIFPTSTEVVFHLLTSNLEFKSRAGTDIGELETSGHWVVVCFSFSVEKERRETTTGPCEDIISPKGRRT